MVLAIEPMVAKASCRPRCLVTDGPVVTRDGSLAAHFEHTVAVTADGPFVLTARNSTVSAGADRALVARPAREESDGTTGPGTGGGGCRNGVEILLRALYRVAVGNGREVVAHAPGGFGRNFVRLLVGDHVTVALSPRDARRGRIVEKR